MTMMLSIGLLLLRLTLGGVFLAHGAQKLFGLFGGPGLSGTISFMDKLGLQPAKWWAIAAALGEFVGGLLIALGLLTPVGAFLIAAVMLAAILKVHWAKGFWNSQGGYEYNFVLFIMSVVLGLVGAGTWSLDTLLSLHIQSPLFYGIALVLLIILGVLVEQPFAGRFQKFAHPSQA
jgi:putative oxidoreductase